jgi:hypothetical protein
VADTGTFRHLNNEAPQLAGEVVRVHGLAAQVFIARMPKFRRAT